MKEKIRKLICKLFGHKCEFSGGIPGMGLYSNARCTRCGKRWRADYSGDVIKHPEDIWKEVEENDNPMEK